VSTSIFHVPIAAPETAISVQRRLVLGSVFQVPLWAPFTARVRPLVSTGSVVLGQSMMRMVAADSFWLDMS
jgi:hypothetical protein